MTMHASRLFRVLFASLVALAGSVSTFGATVAAAPPAIVTQRDIVIDRLHPSFTAACGFPVYLHAEGFVRRITHVDEEGNPTKVIDNAHFHTIFSANGKTLQGTVAGPALIVVNADGTETVTVVGVAQRHAPGAGAVVQAGRVVLTVDEHGEVVEFEAGVYDPLTEVCPLLAPDA